MQRLLALLLVIASSFNLQAQSFEGGIIAGIATSQVSGDLLGGFNKAGLIFGAYTNRAISYELTGKLEITYLQKGSRNPAQDARHEFELNYIEIPLILQYKAQKNTEIEFGLLVGLLLKAKEVDAIYKNEVLLREAFNKTDYGIAIGFNYKLADRIHLNSRLSNTLVFTPIREHASLSERWYNQGQYNAVLSFAIHYQL